MGVHIEAMTDEEVRQVKVRELQQENMAKLDQMIPVVENLENVNLENVQSDTNEIKQVVLNNLEHQPDIQDIIDKIEKIDNKVDTIKKNMTEIKKKNTQINKEIKEMKSKLEG